MKNIDCLIIVPGINSITKRERFTTVYDFPRGALSLGSFLRKKNIPTALLPLDYYVNPSGDSLTIEKQIVSALELYLKDCNPMIVGVSVPYTMLYPVSLKILRYCKELRPEVKCVLGGPHVSYLDRECFRDSVDVDVVVKGEGEWTLLDLITCIKSKGSLHDVRGITFREDDRVVVNPDRPLGDIKDIPVLDYSLLPEGFVRKMGISIVASRGCPYKCTYCNESRFWGNKVRRLPIENVIKEIKQLERRYNNYPVGLEDSMFHMKSSYFLEFCSRLREVRLSPAFYLLSRVDSVTEEGYDAMLRAGIRNIVLGIESASPRVLKIMNKMITMDQAEKACRKAVARGLVVGTFWIIGHPGDSTEDSEITINTIDRFYRMGLIKASEIALFVPYPGTDIFNDPERFGVEILTYEWEKWGRFNTEPVCQLYGFSREEILEAWRKAKRVEEYWRLCMAYHHSSKSTVPGLTEKGGERIVSNRKIGRNHPYPCGSGKKFKKCCGR